MVDISRADRAGSPREAILRHGRHRVPGHGSGRTHPPLRPRSRHHRPHQAGAPGRRRGTARTRGHQERLLRPPAGGVGRSIPRNGGAAHPCRRRGRGTGRSRPRRRRARRAGRGRRRHPLRCDRLLRRAADPGGRDQPARPLTGRRRDGRRRGAWRIAGSPDRRVDRLCRQHAPGKRARGAAEREPFHARCRVEGRGRGGAPCACRPPSGIPPARAAPTVQQEGTIRGGRGRRAPRCDTRRALPGRVGERRARQGGHGSGALARVARRVSLHQGSRGAGARRAVGRDGADHRGPSFHHRVGAHRATAGLDPWLQNGGADHHLVRPRPVARVPRSSRGNRRRDPRRHGRRGHPRRGGARSRTRKAEGLPRGVGRAEPVALRPTGRAGGGILRAKPALRRTWATHQRAGLVVPRPGTGAAPAQARRRGHDRRGADDHCLADPGEAGAAGRPDRGPPRHGQAGPGLCHVVRRVHRDRRSLPGRQPPRAMGLVRRGRPGALRLRSRRHRLGPLRLRRASPVRPRAHPRTHETREVGGGQAASAPASGHPVARAAARRVRPGAHLARLERRRHLRLAGQPPPLSGEAGTLRGRPRPPGAGTAGPGPTGSRRFSPLVLPTLRGRPDRASCGRMRGSSSTASF